MSPRVSTAEAQPARPIEVVAEMVTSTALSLRRLLTGEITPPPRARVLRSLESPGLGQSGGLSLMRVWCVGDVPEPLRLGAAVEAFAGVEDVLTRLTVEARAPDAIVVRDEREAAQVQRSTERPVLLAGPEIRARIRVAMARAVTRQIGGRRG